MLMGGRLSCDRMSPSTLMHEGSRDHSCPCWCASQSVPPNRRRWFGPDARIQAFLAGPRPIPSDVSLSFSCASVPKWRSQVRCVYLGGFVVGAARCVYFGWFCPRSGIDLIHYLRRKRLQLTDVRWYEMVIRRSPLVLVRPPSRVATKKLQLLRSTGIAEAISLIAGAMTIWCNIIVFRTRCQFYCSMWGILTQFPFVFVAILAQGTHWAVAVMQAFFIFPSWARSLVSHMHY